MINLKNNFFKSTLKSIDVTVDSDNDVITRFHHPNLAVITKNQIRIINTDHDDTEDQVLYTETAVRHVQLHKGVLWIMLEGPNLKIINLHTSAIINVIFQNGGFEIKFIRRKDEEIVCISESGDLFTTSLSMKEILEKCKNSQESTIDLKFVRARCDVAGLESDEAHIGGTSLKLTKSSGKQLLIECQSTYTQTCIDFTSEIGHFATFHDSDHIILQLRSETTSLWHLVLTSLTSFNLETNFECSGVPIGGIGDIFLYFTINNGQLDIHRVKRHEPLHVARALAICGKYDEAHDYAIKNDLDVEPLFRMKLLGLVEKVSNGENVVCDEFKVLFEQICDFDFLVDQALKLCQFNIIYKTLAINLYNRFAKKQYKSSKLQEIIAKIEIFEFIELRGGCDYLNMTDVLKEGIDELCIKFVSNGDIDIAAIMWLKRCVVNTDIKHDVALKILNETPQLIKLNALMVWLRTFFPSVLRDQPFFVDTIVQWVIERVFSLEKSKYWPDIGIKFTADIISVIEDSMFTLTSIRPQSIDTLNLLTLHMKTIKHLKETYRVNILIKELTVESPPEVVKIILHRCYTEDLKMLMEEYLPDYISRHGLDYDTLLREYVERLMEVFAVDDTRLSLVVKAMYSNEQRVACVLHVVQNLEIPWSECFHKLAVETSAYHHASSQQIKILLKYNKLKMVLKKYNFPMTYCNYETVITKIVNATEVDLEDMRAVVCVAGRLRDYANLLYVNKCLHAGEVLRALDYCGEFEASEKNMVVKSVTVYLESFLMDSSNKCTVERNYLDFLKGLGMSYSNKVSNLIKLYNLKFFYGISLTANLYAIEMERKAILTEWCKKNGSDMAPDVYYHKGLGLANLLLIEKNVATMCILENMKNKFLHVTLETMLQNCNNLSLEHFIEEFDLSMFFDGKNPELLSSYIKMFTEFVTHCDEELLCCALKILSVFVSIQNSCYFVNNSSISWKFHYIFMPISTYSSMNDFIAYFKKLNNSDNHILPNSIITRNDMVPLRIMAEISKVYMNTQQPLPLEIKNVREKIAKKMVTKILLSQHCDELLVTSLLLMISSPEDWLRDLYSCQSNENTNSALVNYMTLTEKLLGFKNVIPRTAIGGQQVLKNKYNLDVTDYTYTEYIFETTNTKFVVYNVLKSNPNIKMECIQDICKTFNTSLNDALSLQIIALVSSWGLNYQVNKDFLNCKHIDIKNDEKELYSRCLMLMESIKSKEFLIESLKELWNNGELCLGGQTVIVNPYHYEVFICIYHLISKVCSDWKMFREFLVLQFLKQYDRVTTPRQSEMDLFSIKGSFPEIGYYRLPFHMFTKDDMWTNLKYEITLESYSRWLPIVMLLRLDKDSQIAQDMLCSTAVKQTMTQQKTSNETNTERYNLFVTNEGLLKRAHQCVQHISNMEWAAACLFFVLQGTKRGADQLAAAELTYQFAQQWSKLQPNNNVVKKMQYKYCTLSTMHVLHKMGFKDERVLQLCTDPNTLIKTLYGEKTYCENMLEFNVNKFIDEIADKNGVNIVSIRYQILENILDQKKKRASEFNSVGLDTSELTRARHILKATCPNMGAIYFVRIGLDSDNDFNKAKKLRALQCLISIVEPETLTKISNMDRAALQKALLDLYFSIELEHIDMPFLVATFIEDKKRAIDQVWQSAEKSTDMLKVIARMGTVYGIDDDIVEEVLSSLIRYDLVDELRMLVPQLKCTHLLVYNKAWSKVLLQPFVKADHPVGERQRKLCLTTINMLPKCPSINESDLLDIWKNCNRCKCLEIGCLVLPYMKPETRYSLTDWKKMDRRSLIAGIKNLHAETFLVIAALAAVESLTLRTL